MTVFLSPVGGAGVQFFDNNGNPLSGGKLYTYAAGTTTPSVTYTTSTGNVAHPNPIILDSAGRVPDSHEIWLSRNEFYKFVLKNSLDVEIWTVDNITGTNDSEGDLVNVKDFGAVCNGTTDDSAALVSANAFAAANNLSMVVPGVMEIASPVTITANLLDTTNQMFTPTSSVSIHNGMEIRPDWWGTGAGTLIKAIDALPSTGGDIRMLPRDYNIVGYWHNSASVHVGNEKPNVKLRGSGMPRTSSDGTRYISGSGTVIQGSVVNYANGFEAYDFGVDVGSYVNATYNFGGYAPDGFVAGTHKFQGTPGDLTTYIQYVAFNNIKCLAVNNLNHAILCEFINGLSHGYCEAEGGYHGYVCKSTNVVGGNVWVYGQAGDGYIFKSDEYTRCSNVEINSISLGKKGYATRTAAGLFQSVAGGHTTSRVNIGQINGWFCKELFTRIGDATAPITDIMIGSIMGDDIDGNGFSVLGDMRRIQINSHIISNPTANGVYVDSSTGESIDVGSGVVTNSDVNGYYFTGANHIHGDIKAINSAAWGVNRTGGSLLEWNRVSGSGNGSGLASSLNMLLTAADLQNSWANGVGTWPFQVVLIGNTLYVRGTVRNGTTGVIATLPVGYRPSLTLSFMTVGITAGGVRAFSHVDIGSSGDITVSNFAGAVPGLGGTGCIVALNFNYIL